MVPSTKCRLAVGLVLAICLVSVSVLLIGKWGALPSASPAENAEALTTTPSPRVSDLSFSSSRQPRREIKVGIASLDYPPFYFEQDGQLRGAAFEIATEVARSQGYTLRIHRYPWTRIQNLLKSGDVEMMILYFKTPRRGEDVIYAEIPHLFESSKLFVRADSKITFSGDLHDLKPYLFGNVRGYSHGKAYDEAEYLQKQVVNNEEQLIRILVYGRIDVAVCNPQAITMYANRLGLGKKIRFLEPPVANEPNYFAFSKACQDAPVIAREFSEGLRAFMQTPAYREILVKYHFDPELPAQEGLE